MELWKHVSVKLAVIVIWTIVDQQVVCYIESYENRERKISKPCDSDSHNGNSEQLYTKNDNSPLELINDVTDKTINPEKLSDQKQGEHCEGLIKDKEQHSENHTECMMKLNILDNKISDVNNSVEMLRNHTMKYSDSMQTDMQTLKKEMASKETEVNSRIHRIEENQSQNVLKVKNETNSLTKKVNVLENEHIKLDKIFQTEKAHIHSRFNKEAVDNKERLTSLKETIIRKLETKLDFWNEKMIPLKVEQKKLSQDFQVQTTRIHSRFNKEARDNKERFTLFKETKIRELERKLDSLNAKIVTLEFEQKKLRQDFHVHTVDNAQAHSRFEKEASENKKSLISLKDTIRSLESKLQGSVEENESLKKNISFLSKKVENIENAMQYYKDKVPSIDSRTRQMDAEMKTVLQNILMVLLLLVVILTLCGGYYVKNTRADLTKKVESNQTVCKESNDARLNKRSPLMDMIRPQTLQRSLGVVSFDQSRSKSHKELMEDVMKSGNIEIEVVQTTISDEEMVLEISPSKVVFIFVDANNRNIILEDPNQEIGGFRGTTTEALIKMGCEVFVIYSKDLESSGLEATQYFHKRLRSIKRHKLLTSLSQRGRVMSINDRFHDHQIQFLHKELQKFFC